MVPRRVRLLLVEVIIIFNALAMLPVRARGWGSAGLGGWLSLSTRPLPTLRERGFQFQLPARERACQSRLSAAFSSDASEPPSSAASAASAAAASTSASASASAAPDSLVAVLDEALEKEATKRASLER